MAAAKNALIDLTEDELRDALRRHSGSVVFSYEDLVRELDRRANRKLAAAQLYLSVVSIAIAVGALLVSLLN